VSKRALVVTALSVLAVLGTVLLLYPTGEMIDDGPTQHSNAPEMGPDTAGDIVISDARIVLPPTAGEFAAIYFDVTNEGSRNAIIRTITVEHTSGVQWYDTNRPEPAPVENFSVGPGETLRFTPDAQFLIGTRYGEEVVPGATIRFTLTMANAETVSANAIVEPSPAHQN